MPTKHVGTEKGSHDSHCIRPKYIDIGTDSRGREHCYDTVTETVHIVNTDADVAFTGEGRAKRVDLAADDDLDCIEDYVDKYAKPDDRCWADLRYGVGPYFSGLSEAV